MAFKLLVNHVFLLWNGIVVTKKLVIFLLQDIYCLDADGSLFDAALLSAVAAFSHCKNCILFIIS